MKTVFGVCAYGTTGFLLSQQLKLLKQVHADRAEDLVMLLNPNDPNTKYVFLDNPPKNIRNRIKNIIKELSPKGIIRCVSIGCNNYISKKLSKAHCAPCVDKGVEDVIKYAKDYPYCSNEGCNRVLNFKRSREFCVKCLREQKENSDFIKRNQTVRINNSCLNRTILRKKEES